MISRSLVPPQFKEEQYISHKTTSQGGYNSLRFLATRLAAAVAADFLDEAVKLAAIAEIICKFLGCDWSFVS